LETTQSFFVFVFFFFLGGGVLGDDFDHHGSSIGAAGWLDEELTFSQAVG
jgi:hypothetical protein